MHKDEAMKQASLKRLAEAKSIQEVVKVIDDLAAAKGRVDNSRADADSMYAKMYGPYDDTGELGMSDSASDNGRRMFFGKKMAQAIATKSYNKATKSVASSGGAVVPQEFRPDPIAEGKAALSLLDVIPVTTHSTPNYAYLQQTTRTNNAAVWTSGAKPTSVYSVTRIEKSLSVIAHMSEPIQEYWLQDNASLTGFIQSEMLYGLQTAVQAKILSDIAGTSGIDTQAYSTSVIQTIRKGMTKLESNGYVPSFVAMAPLDWEGIELALTSTSAIEFQNLPFNSATRRLFGLPVVVVPALPAATTGWLIAQGAVALDTDSFGVQTKWSEAAWNTGSPGHADFELNQVRARMEGRYGTSVYQPLGVVNLDLSP